MSQLLALTRACHALLRCTLPYNLQEKIKTWKSEAQMGRPGTRRRD
jgi:hypothetical protein